MRAKPARIVAALRENIFQRPAQDDDHQYRVDALPGPRVRSCVTLSLTIGVPIARLAIEIVCVAEITAIYALLSLRIDDYWMGWIHAYQWARGPWPITAAPSDQCVVETFWAGQPNPVQISSAGVAEVVPTLCNQALIAG